MTQNYILDRYKTVAAIKTPGYIGMWMTNDHLPQNSYLKFLFGEYFLKTDKINTTLWKLSFKLGLGGYLQCIITFFLHERLEEPHLQIRLDMFDSSDYKPLADFVHWLWASYVRRWNDVYLGKSVLTTWKKDWYSYHQIIVFHQIVKVLTRN